MKKLFFTILFGSLFTLLEAQRVDTVKIAAVGDIMLGTSYPDSSFLPGKDCFHLFRPLQKYLTSADITFGNLEGAITDDLTDVKDCFTEGRCYYFAMPATYTHALNKAGFDILSLANNHINDFGTIGRKSTKRNLRSHQLRHAGLIDHPWEIFMYKGVKYGFCAFAPNALTVSIKDIKKAVNIVHNLDSLCDIVIVSFHAGGEGVEYQNVTRKTEYYIGENRGNVYEFAHKVIDAGADVLLGHGPHVPRAVEVYKDRFIAYSMGNFLTYSRISVAGKCGIAPIFHIFTDKKGRFLEAQIIPTYQQKYQAPKFDPQNKVIKIIQELTVTDFPEMKNVIRIEDNGRIVNLLRK